MSFETLGLHPQLLSAIAASGYTEPTPVQQQAIPAALSGQDLLVSSHTGSGKTAAFILPALQRLLEQPANRHTQTRILVLTPTRELALQVEKAALTYGHGQRGLRTACLVGGVAFREQMRRLNERVDLIVATPGRLLDYLNRRKVHLGDLEVLVLDEADRMLDMGFIEDIEAIVAHTPKTRQTLLFSATLDGVVGNLATRMTRDPQAIRIGTDTRPAAHIEQKLLFADNLEHKNKLLGALLEDPGMEQAVVFTSTKRSAEDLARHLEDKGVSAAALHGDMHQSVRNRTLHRLRTGRVSVLVATDVAARGIDVAGISHVINFDAPRQAEDYVHRIGRTGRAGRSGQAFTLSGPGDIRVIRNIERHTGQRLAELVIPGLEPSPRAARSAPPKGRRPGGSSGAPRKPGFGAPRSAGSGGGYGNGNSGGNGGNSYGDRPARPAGDAPRRFNSRDDRPRSGGFSDAPRRRDYSQS